MSNLAASAGWGLAVGASLVLGAVAASWLSLPERVAAWATAFGGGLLLAAVALELVPEADRGAGAGLTAAGLVAGTLIYVLADARLSRSEDARMMRRAGHAAAAGREMEMPARPDHAEAARGESIAAGLFIDGVPESIALGLSIADNDLGLALLVGVLLGNVVEAYGASQPIVAGGHTRAFAIRLMALIGAALLAATVLGGTVLSDASHELIGTLQAVAGGAVLAVITIAIVPHAFVEVNRGVAAATVLGFVTGYLLA